MRRFFSSSRTPRTDQPGSVGRSGSARPSGSSAGAAAGAAMSAGAGARVGEPVRHVRRVSSPVGEISIVLDDDARLLGLYQDDQNHLPEWFAQLAGNTAEQDDATESAVQDTTGAYAAAEATTAADAAPADNVEAAGPHDEAFDALESALTVFFDDPHEAWDFNGQPLVEVTDEIVTSVAGVPVADVGSEFQRRVWGQIAAIAPGDTRSYGDIAMVLDSSPRAVGSATGRNPWGFLVPCHRVVGSDGSLTGYAGGVDTKNWLLRREGAQIQLW